jgi:hypothetical protein
VFASLYLLRNRLATGIVDIAIDGAQDQRGGTVHSALADFLEASGRTPQAVKSWKGHHPVVGCKYGIRIHSTPGQGDVVAKLSSGRTLRAECKKGPLSRSRSSQEYPLLREAIGQLMTVDHVEPTDILAVAVPWSPKFAELTSGWRSAPLVRRIGIHLLTVNRDGHVSGFEMAAV